jgi:hypothetical protein
MDKWAIVFLPFEQNVFDASDAGRALCVCVDAAKEYT